MTTGPIRPSYRMIMDIVRFLLKVIFGLRIYDTEKVPLTGRLLIVSNHIAALDPAVVGSTVPREVHFVAKIQLFKGLFGKFIRHLNAVPVKRSGSDKEAIKVLRSALLEDKAVLIFPEGTRTPDPEKRDLKLGVGMLAVMSGADLIPMRVDGTVNLMRAFFRKPGVSVHFGNVIKLSSIIEDGLPKKELYHRISYALMDEITKLEDS
ncbi:MAG: lysophospholipid acyltransferase family protein [Candidatus Electryonea clarkiae]|nr:lysophospholipid acyltransferase family protein [Candidatus Electryonea clarkiae]MDP8285279.1 lysophospholipid acyltransferase family protein [Candidatus Electryonea clarkiae]